MGSAGVCGESGWLCVIVRELGIVVRFRGFLGMLGCGILVAECLCGCVNQCVRSVRLQSIQTSAAGCFCGELGLLWRSQKFWVAGDCEFSAEDVCCV